MSELLRALSTGAISGGAAFSRNSRLEVVQQIHQRLESQWETLIDPMNASVERYHLAQSGGKPPLVDEGPLQYLSLLVKCMNAFDEFFSHLPGVDAGTVWPMDVIDIRGYRAALSCMHDESAVTAKEHRARFAAMTSSLQA